MDLYWKFTLIPKKIEYPSEIAYAFQNILICIDRENIWYDCSSQEITPTLQGNLSKNELKSSVEMYWSDNGD